MDREIQTLHPDTTLLGWDPSLQQRGIFPNPAASWDLLSDSHAEIIAICTIIMWLAWFWGPKPQLTAGKKGEGEEGRELGSTQRNGCKLTTSPHLIFGNYWTSCPLCLWLSETVTTYKLGWGAPMRINAHVQQAGPGQSAPRMLFPFLFYRERQHPTILSTESLINFGKPCYVAIRHQINHPNQKTLKNPSSTIMNWIFTDLERLSCFLNRLSYP